MAEDPAVTATRAATTTADPGAGLRAVADMRAAADALEARQVDRAVRAGWSWAQVGRALGISKQAAHRRHAGREPGTEVPEARHAGAAAGDERIMVTGAAQDVVQRAREEAAARRQSEVQPAHLLAALARAPAGPAQDALHGLGVDADALRAAVGPTESDGGRRFSRRPGIAPATRRVLEGSLHEAQRLCHGHLGPEHLLLALLREPDGQAVEVLTGLGAQAQDVEAAVCDVLKHTDFARSQ